MKSYSDHYKQAGVDITAGYRAVELMKMHVAHTMNSQVISGLGGFGGLFELDLTGIQKPVLVSGTDGVGTKLKVAFLMDKHDTIGIDCVAMCVNDVICCGAKPLFFLDYIALGKNIPQKVSEIVSGIATGCVEADVALVGGETAEMPGFYAETDYDLAGFTVGIVDKDHILRHEYQKQGDILIGIASSGLHSNGFSLVRHLLDLEHTDLSKKIDDLGSSLGEVLLTPTKIYVKSILTLLQDIEVRAISHITGGGFYENIPRSIPKNLSAKIERDAIHVLPIFDYLMKRGQIPWKEMYNTFNMGIGMIISVPASCVDKALHSLKNSGETAYVIGELVPGDNGVLLC